MIKRIRLMAVCLSALPCLALAQEPATNRPLAGAAQGAIPAAPEIELDAMLRRIRDAMHGSKSYHVDIQCDWTSRGAGHESSGKHLVKLTVVNPDKLRLEISSDIAPDAKYVVISDGKTIFRAFTGQGLYSLTGSRNPRQDIESDGLTLSSLQASGVEFLLRHDAYGAIASQIVRVEDQGRKVVGGQACRVFDVLLASKLKATAAISEASQPLPIQHRIERTIPMADGTTHDYIATTNLVWDLNPRIDAAAFEIHPPIEGRRVPDFNAYFNAGLSEATIGSPAPRLAWDTLDGNRFSLHGEQGKATVVLYFWATWAAPSADAIAELAKFVEHYSQRGVRFVAINVGEPVEDVRAFVDRSSFKETVGLDPKGESLAALAIDSIPATVLIDQEGKLRAVHKGLGVRDRVAADLEAIVNRATAKRK